MKLHTLKAKDGSTKNRKRLGRGQGSGRGGTATRGHKGAQSRSGYSRKFGFEGGQMPLQRRIPKFGFKNPNRIEYKAINLDTIQGLADASKEQAITVELLVANGLVGKNDLVKVLGRGDLTAKVDVSAHKFSATASESIEKAGGKVVIVK